MLTTQTRLRLQSILKRLAADQTVSLKERIELQKYSDHDPTVGAWLCRAKIQQRRRNGDDVGDPLLDALDLGSSEPHSEFHPEQDDLGDWFQGAPPWLRRS